MKSFRIPQKVMNKGRNSLLSHKSQYHRTCTPHNSCGMLKCRLKILPCRILRLVLFCKIRTLKKQAGLLKLCTVGMFCPRRNSSIPFLLRDSRPHSSFKTTHQYQLITATLSSTRRKKALLRNLKPLRFFRVVSVRALITER